MLHNNFQATTYDGSVDSFHTYAIDWNQSRIVFYKDGQASAPLLTTLVRDAIHLALRQAILSDP